MVVLGGSILALPATLLLKAIMIDADPHSRWINTFIASDLRGMEDRNRTALARLRSDRSEEGADGAQGVVVPSEAWTE